MGQGRTRGVAWALGVALGLWVVSVPITSAQKERRVVLPGSAEAMAYAEAARPGAAAIDRLVLDAAQASDLEPTAVIDDAAFLRRVTVDLIARIPSMAEYERYFADPPEHRRAMLVDRLLNHPRFADRWAMFFGDMMNVRSSADGGSQLHRFIRDSIRDRKPYDQMVRQIITATGTLRDNAPVGFFMGVDADPLQVTGVLTQTLMGVRMQCAQCHDHPYDVWTQKDYYGLAAYFGSTDVRYLEESGALFVGDVDRQMVMWPPRPRKNRPQKPVDPQWPLADADADEAGLARAVADMQEKKQDHAEQQAIADLLAAVEHMDDSGGDAAMLLDDSSKVIDDIHESEKVASKREVFADLICSPTNRFFGWNVANRVWGELVGRGIVHPVDDLKADNPPSHPELLDHLADGFVASNYDLRGLVAMVVMSEAYQRSAVAGAPAKERRARERAFVAAPLRRMNAESIYDSIRLAGHVGKPKHSPGLNMRDIHVRVRVPVKTVEEVLAEREAAAAAKDDAAGEAAMMPAGVSVTVEDPYASERQLDVDALLKAIAEQEDDPLMGNRVVEVNPDDVDPAAIAARESAAADPQRFKYVTVTQRIDDNPEFASAMRIRAPAPPEHFLRQFGQTSRVILGEKRDAGANTRQALLLLNGKLSNQAARVGDLEPVYKLLHEERDPADVISFVYVECLTREPTAAERDAALAMFSAYDDRAQAVADLRWAIFNSHGFRYVP